MSKSLSNAITDLTLNGITGFNNLTLCAGFPIDLADVVARKLGNITITSGDFTISNGSVAGSRKVVIAGKSGITITVTGTADHVAYDDGSEYLVTSCTPTAVSSGETRSVSSTTYEIGALT